MVTHLLFLLSFFSSAPAQDVSHGTVSNDSLTVHIFLHDECMISQFYTPKLNEFYNVYHSSKVGFVGYFPSKSCVAPDVKGFAEKYSIPFQLKSDHNKVVTKEYGITVTPEVAVWDHRTNLVIYKGRIDDCYVRVGKRKTHIQNDDLKDVIVDWIAGNDVSYVETRAIGCIINMNDTTGED